MKQLFFTPGPTQLYPSVEKLIEEALRHHIPSISHRSKQFEKIFAGTVESLRELMTIPKSSQIFFLGSATEAMERIIENCVERTSFHFVNGAFAERFLTTAQELKKNAQACHAQAGDGFEPLQIVVPEQAELICITHNETSTGVTIPASEIHALAKKHPKTLLAVDFVSSAPIATLDLNLIDCAFFSVQKCFGLPAGLGVLIVSARALERSHTLQTKNTNVGSYHSFQSLEAHARRNQTPETPNVLGIYLLGRMCEEFLKIGITTLRRDSAKKAAMIYDHFERHATWRPFVETHKFRSETVVTVSTPENAPAIIRALEAKSIAIGSGYGEFKEDQLRIANFPSHQLDDVTRLISALGEL